MPLLIQQSANDSKFWRQSLLTTRNVKMVLLHMDLLCKPLRADHQFLMI